jgi:hypothetical protein
VNVLGGDFRLTTNSPAIGKAQGIYCGDGFVDEVGIPAATWEYDFANGGGWIPRSADGNLGAWESDPLAP